MEESMEMDEERIPVYDAVEFDFDYEFDAPRFVDFTRSESFAELRQSESWFCSAPDYPPSPFVAQLFPLMGVNSQHVDVSPKSKYDERSVMEDSDSDDDIGDQWVCCGQDEAYREESRQALLQKLCYGDFPNVQSQAKCLHTGPSADMTFYNHIAHDIKKTTTKTLAKPYMRKTSTLMKPTASQLAKQNQRQVCGSRLQKNEGISGAHCSTEGQASKRQKLDGGLLRRIGNVKQTVNLTHKLPKKETAVQGMNAQNKLRLTIPREPDLATAHRAERMRTTNSKETENRTATVRRFKAQPLNRKTLKESVPPLPRRTIQHEPDLRVYHLKTTGSVKQHTTDAASTTVCQIDKAVDKVHDDNSLQTVNKDGKRIDSADVAKRAVGQVVHTFKARPLDKKILSSRGDIGVFRNNKRDVTVPKEFEFQTAKRTQHNLPIDLFSKLSLAGEPQSKPFSQVVLPQRTSIPTKGSKENRWEPCQENHKIVKERRDNPCGKERLTIVNGGMLKVASHNTLSRPFSGWKQ